MSDLWCTSTYTNTQKQSTYLIHFYLTLERLRQENCAKFEANLGYTVEFQNNLGYRMRLSQTNLKNKQKTLKVTKDSRISKSSKAVRPAETT